MANNESANYSHSSLVWALKSANSSRKSSKANSCERTFNQTERVNQYDPSESENRRISCSYLQPDACNLDESQTEHRANKLTSKSNDKNEHKITNETASADKTSKISKITKMNANCFRWKGNLFNLIIINTILSQIDENFLFNSIELRANSKLQTRRNLPNIIFAGKQTCLSILFLTV